MKKRISGLMALLMCSQLVLPNLSVFAEETTELVQSMDYNTGLLETELIVVDGVPEEMILEEGEYNQGIATYSATYTSQWDSYSSNYVYNFLDEEERAFWDRLDVVCAQMLLTTDAANEWVYGDTTYRHTAYADFGGISEDEALELMKIFKCLNPQYYFLNPSILYGDTYGAFGVYSAFGDGSARQAATESVKAQTDTWKAIAEGCATEAEKVKVLHDLVVNKVEYNSKIYDADFDEEVEFSQSAYSVFCMDKTVCTGYARAFTMMCNAVGVDCFSVTSADHQWNKVRINDSWYNVDCTWDDQTTIYYNYFERSDLYYDSDDEESVLSHTEECIWEKYLPACTLDSGASWTDAGTLPTITQTVANPTISIVTSANAYSATITSSTPNAIIYYTLDGTEPTPAYTKSYRYSDTFEVPANAEVRAVAVCDTYWDSGVVTANTGDSTHGHQWSGAWNYNTTHHWHECDASGCTIANNSEKNGYGTHAGGTAYCNRKATCATCGIQYGNVSAGNHTGGTEVRNAVAATATKDGYTGDTYCKGCNTKIASGTVMPATGGNSNGATDLVNSNSVTGKARFVALLYENVLERYAASSEIDWWVQELGAGKTGSEVAYGFIFSPEFKNKNLSDSNYVERLYMSMMGRASDSNGKEYWMTCLDNGVSREYVFKQFIDSREFQGLCNAYGIQKGEVRLSEARDQNYNVTCFVVRNYKQFLGRDYEVGGLNYWCDIINNRTQSMQRVAYGFVFSDECINKNLSNTDYIKMLYRGCFDREGEQAGVAYWAERLDSGEINRTEAFYGFADSQEFANMVQSYGL